MGLRDTFLNMLGAETPEVQKTDNSVYKSARDFLRYGNREKLYPDWSDVKMADSDMYRGYSYAVIQKRSNKVASLAKENLSTWAKPEIVDAFQKKNETVLHPYLKLIEDSTKFSEKQFWKTISIYLDLAGRYYLGVVRTQVRPTNPNLPVITTDPTEFVMLNPYEIRRVVDKDKHVAGYIERKKDGRYREWPLWQIIEMRELNPFDPENSQWAMTDAAKEAVYTMNQSGDYTRQSLHGNIEAPGIITTDVLLNDEDFRNFRERVTQHTKGEPLFGNGTGAIKWDAMQIDLDKAALMDINEINRTTLFAVSGTSKTSLGIEQSGTTRETARVQTEQFVSDTAQPRLEDIVDFLNLDYRKNYFNEYKQTGYYIEIKSAVGRDYDTEQKAVALKQQQFQLAMQLIQSGYTTETAYQFAEGEIDFADLELEKGLDKPINPEEPEGGDETPSNSPNNGPQSGSGGGDDTNTTSQSNNGLEAKNGDLDLNELEPHSDLQEGEKSDPLDKKENGGSGSGNFGHAGRPGEVGGSSKEGSTLSESVIDKVAEEYGDNITFTSGKENPLTRALAEEQGFLNEPKKVSQEEYDKAIKDGGKEVFRGVKQSPNATTQEVVDDFVNGEAWYGNGDFGAGIYTTSELSVADAYTSEADGSAGLMKMVIPSDAKVLKYSDAVAQEYHDFVTNKISEYSKKSEEAWGKGDEKNGERYEKLASAYDSMGFTDYAIIKGYDVFDASHDRGIYVVLNRSKVLVVKNDPTVRFDGDKRVNEVCTCEHDHKIETFMNGVQPEESKIVKNAYDDFLEEVRAIEKETINAVARKLTTNAFDQDDLIGKRKRASLTEKFKNAIKDYWWLLLPLLANNDMGKRNEEFGKNVIFTFDNALQNKVIDNAGRVAEGHMNTVLDDILETSNKVYTQILEGAAADLIIRAYEDNPTKYEAYFSEKPTRADALKSIQNTDILEKNKKIYDRANKMAFEGYKRGDIVKAVRAEYKDISENRATLIARNETARAFGKSQFEADRQFLNSIGKMEQAYKVWYSRRPASEQDKICPFCRELIDQTNANPIPFDEPFIKYGDSMEVVENGKVKIFTADYENIEGSTLHPNCACGYKLVFKNSDGTFSKTLNGGQGSGNFGHSGRPGEVGGSGKGAILGENGHGIKRDEKELKEEWDSFDDDVLMSEDTKKMLKTYYFGSWYFNNIQKVAREKYLDTMEKDEIKKATEVKDTLDDLIDGSALDKDLTLYRGITMTDENADKIKNGSVITDKGFASTSLDPSETTRLRGMPTTGGKRNIIVLKINAKKGSKGLKSPVSADNSEYEVVLPRNTKFKVKSISDWKDFYESEFDKKYDNKRVKVVEVDYE